MTNLATERWRRLEALVHAALARPASERAAFLAGACGDDEELRREAESLIDGAESGGAFLETPGAGASLVGRQLGAYRLEQLVGAGGMGEVYRAKDPRLGRDVAVKILPAAWVADPQRRARFEREARAIAALNHPHICTIHDVGRDNGIDYLVMEFVDGEPLAARLAQGPLPVDQALARACEIADALDCAHRQGVIHRDLKPGNVMLTRARAGGSRGVQAKLVDFGLARMLTSAAADSTPPTATSPMTATGAVMGTPRYMAPEQIEGRPADARTDVFAFGGLLFEMLTGRPAFDGATAPSIMAAILRADPPSLAAVQPSLPRSLERLVHACLAKDPSDRVSSMHDVLLQLRGIAEELRPSTSGLPTAGRARRKFGLAIAATLIVLASAAVAWRFLAAAPILSERDTILIADFANTTSDIVFNDTLKQALAISLEQSTFMSTLSEERIEEALKLMAKPPDERLTRAIAQEICQRQNLKAFIAGSIAPIGREYAISLEAVSGQTGDVLARELEQVRSKEEVLTAVGIAASRMRARLGEPLASIQKYDVPLQIATTSSLEALRAYSIGIEHFRRGRWKDAVDAYTQATVLDPNFAKAWDSLVPAYGNLSNSSNSGLSRDASTRAYALRDRVSERERLVIEARYQLVEHDLTAAFGYFDRLVKTYPDRALYSGNIAQIQRRLGEPEKAVESASEAVRHGSQIVGPFHLALALLSIGNAEEAWTAIDRPDLFERSSLRARFEIATVLGDPARLGRTIERAKAETDPVLRNTLGALQSEAAWFEGRAAPGLSAAETSMRYAAFGDCRKALAEAGRSKDPSLEAALAMSWCGNSHAAEDVVSKLHERYPNGTLENGLWIPLIHAAAVLEHDPRQALKRLEPIGQLEQSNEAVFRPQYLRGLAYLGTKQFAEAAAEFQRILDHRGRAALSPLYPLAHLGLARASKDEGKLPKARAEYLAFFAIWENADRDLPILVAARREYAALK